MMMLYCVIDIYPETETIDMMMIMSIDMILGPSGYFNLKKTNICSVFNINLQDDCVSCTYSEYKKS